MKYAVFGPFNLSGDDVQRELRQDLWIEVEQEQEGLSRACGCYVFAIRFGSSTTPWYVGKAERQAFRAECCQPHKVTLLKELLANRRGTLLLYLLPRMTATRGHFSKTTKNSYRDVDYLESMLIGMALRKNPLLINVKKTRLLREMTVPGIINSPRRAPTDAELHLKEIFQSKRL